MTRIGTTCTVVLACLLCLTVAAQDSREESILGVKQDLLFERLGVHRLRAYSVWVDQFGCGYTLSCCQMKIAVNPGHESTDYSLGLLTAILPISPNMADQSIGDEIYSWLREEGGGGTVVLRVRNVTIRFNWRGSKGAGLEFARRIAHILETDDEVAPKGHFSPKPDVVSLGLPKRLVVGEQPAIIPVMQGMGPSEKVAFMVAGRGGGLTVFASRGILRMKDGTVPVAINEYGEPGVGGRMEVTMYAVNDDNLFLRRKVELTLDENGRIVAKRNIPYPSNRGFHLFKLEEEQTEAPEAIGDLGSASGACQPRSRE